MTTGNPVLFFFFCYGCTLPDEHQLPNEFWEGHSDLVAYHLNIDSLQKQTSFFRHHFLLPLLCIAVNSSHSPAEVGKYFIPFTWQLSFCHSVEIFTGICRGRWLGGWVQICLEAQRCWRPLSIRGFASWICWVSRQDIFRDTYRNRGPSAAFRVSSSRFSRSVLDTGQRPQQSMASNRHFSEIMWLFAPQISLEDNVSTDISVRRIRHSELYMHKTYQWKEERGIMLVLGKDHNFKSGLLWIKKNATKLKAKILLLNSTIRGNQMLLQTGCYYFLLWVKT